MSSAYFLTTGSWDHTRGKNKMNINGLNGKVQLSVFANAKLPVTSSALCSVFVEEAKSLFSTLVTEYGAQEERKTRTSVYHHTFNMDMKIFASGEPASKGVSDNVDRTVGVVPPVMIPISEGGPEANYRNWYAAKKSVSEGLFDVALLSANGAQLKHVLQLGPGFEFYLPVLVLVSLSIGLQVTASQVSQYTRCCF
ncbi:hypothetical protein V5799_000303 [Amblyomma americanum]|uniref:Uncharacterized protein n=1 Tax=Amblyomma americanum TaxID=6943 RepID=A0AAQ4D3F5_AMBAM